MQNHKHCKRCKAVIIPSYDDNCILDKEVFARDVAYSGGFCENCIEEFGLEYLSSEYPNEAKK